MRAEKHERGRILVIDDEPELLALIRELLANEGYRVFCASNGMQGIRLDQTKQPDLIILDLRMPGMDGIETLRRIRWDDPHARVIILTAYKSEDSGQAAANLDVSEYLSKPFECQDLIRLAAALIGQRRRKKT